MGKPRTSGVEARSRRGLIAVGLVLAVWSGAPALAICPGPGCPAISLDVMAGGDCPGGGCPAFARSIEDQQAYVGLFGALQSGSDAPRPMEGRLLVDLDYGSTEDISATGVDAIAARTCAILQGAGVLRAEVIGLATDPDAPAEARAEAFADTLSKTCEGTICDSGTCPQVAARPPMASDALPTEIDLGEGITLIELRVVP